MLSGKVMLDVAGNWYIDGKCPELVEWGSNNRNSEVFTSEPQVGLLNLDHVSLTYDDLYNCFLWY